MEYLQIHYNDLETKIFINNNTTFYEIYKTSLQVFQLDYKNVIGLKFYTMYNNEKFIGTNEFMFSNTYQDFIEEYDLIRDFYIENREGFQSLKMEIQNNFENNTQTNNVFQNLFGNMDRGRNIINMNNPHFHVINNFGTNNETTNRPPPTLYTMDFDYNPTTRRFNTRNQNLSQSLFHSRLPQQNAFSSLFDIILGYGDTREVLTQEQIDMLPQGRYIDLKNQNLLFENCNQCTISLEYFSDDTEVIALPCKHAFLKSSITQWLKNNSNKCPTCRMTVANGNLL